MRLKNKSDLYSIANNIGISKETADSFINMQLELGMIEALCDGWYVHYE